MKQALLVLTLVLFGASHARAQDASVVPVVQDRDIQLDQVQQHDVTGWIEDVRDYAAWYDRYRNRIARNIFGVVGERQQIPPVLPWLPAKCELLADFVPRPDGSLAEACDLLAFYRSNFTIEPGAQQATLAQKQNEQHPHASFWKHLHLDAGWAGLDYRRQTYGLVGMHVTLPEIAGRVQVYLPPGFLLLSLPDGHGSRTLQPAATVGVSIKMFGFEFPQNRAGTAYFNLAKAFVVDHASSPTGTESDVDLMGLSFAWGR